MSEATWAFRCGAALCAIAMAMAATNDYQPEWLVAVAGAWAGGHLRGYDLPATGRRRQ